MTHALPDPETTATVVHRPSFEALREFSAHLETTTEFGSPSYVSAVRSRSAERTANAVDDEFDAADATHLDRARETVTETPFVCVDRRLGRHPELSAICRLYVPKPHARIALSWAKLLEPAPTDAEPDLVTLQIPDWSETRIRVFPDEGVTYVLGSDYTGEAKKSFLRLFMYRAKQLGGLGIHAGSKRVTVADGEEDLDAVGQLFLGLSATGKTTLTCHRLGLRSPEGAALVQDDVCALLPDGTVAGTEGGGLFIKTHGLAADAQPALHAAATTPAAVLENVAVDEDGTVDFADDTLTSNGRATVRRDDVHGAAESIDLDAVDQGFFITRNRLMPPIARLSPAEAATAFMLGESIETSAGDPDRAGEAIRVVGTNPFIIGSPGAEGNRFLELCRSIDVEWFLLNTGAVGHESPRDIGVADTVAILDAVARGTVEWTADDALGLTIPTAIPGVDIERLHPPTAVADFAARLAELRADRRAYLDDYPDLDPAIAETALVVNPARARSE